MCYSDDAPPPFLPGRGAALDGGRLVLTSSAGAPVSASGARARGPDPAGIVILPDFRGLHHFYEELALRFAEAGVAAVAVGYFGRTAGHGPRDDSFEFRPHLERTTP